MLVSYLSLAPTGSVVLADGNRLHVVSDVESIPFAERTGLSARSEAGEDLPPGRLVALVDGRLYLATLPLGNVIGVTLRRSGVDVWEAGDQPYLMRRGIATVDGATGNDLDAARVTDGGLFVVSGGEIVPGAVFYQGAVELNF